MTCRPYSHFRSQPPQPPTPRLPWLLPVASHRFRYRRPLESITETNHDHHIHSYYEQKKKRKEKKRKKKKKEKREKIIITSPLTKKKKHHHRPPLLLDERTMADRPEERWACTSHDLLKSAGLCMRLVRLEPEVVQYFSSSIVKAENLSGFLEFCWWREFPISISFSIIHQDDRDSRGLLPARKSASSSINLSQAVYTTSNIICGWIDTMDQSEIAGITIFHDPRTNDN